MAVSFQVGKPAAAFSGCRASCARHWWSVGKALERGREAGDVAGWDDDAFPTVVDEMRQVPRPPPDDREPGGQRLAVDRSVRLAVARQHERIGHAVQPGDLVAGDGTVAHHPIGQVRSGEASPHAGAVAGLDVLAADEVQQGEIGIDAGERLEQFERALAGHPVADAEEGDRTAARGGRAVHRSAEAPRRCPAATTTIRSAGKRCSATNSSASAALAASSRLQRR